MDVFETELVGGTERGANAVLSDVDTERYRETVKMLRETWVYSPREPLVMNGFAIRCPRCGSADDLRLWLFAGRTSVEAQHWCGGTYARAGKHDYRRWEEPRLTVEYMHQHGETVLGGRSRDVEIDLGAWIARQRASQVGEGDA